MRGEDEAVFGQAGVFENFGRVPVREQVVGLEIFVQFGEVQVLARLLAGAGSALAFAMPFLVLCGLTLIALAVAPFAAALALRAALE